MIEILHWLLRVVIFILCAWFYAGMVADTHPDTAIVEGILAATYFYLLFYCLLLILQPLLRTLRTLRSARRKSRV